MPTVNFVQQHTRNDGTAQIYIRIIENRKVKYVKTGYYVKPGCFKKEQVVHHPDAKRINQALEAQRSRVMDEYYRADILGEAVNDPSLIEAIKAKLNELETSGKVATFNRLLTNLDYIKEVFPHDIKLSKVNADAAEKYAAFRYKKGNGANTIKKNLKDISSVLKFAGFTGVDPFYKKAASIMTIPVKKEKVTPGELAAIESVECDGLFDIARDMWLFSFYTHGARFESVATFEREWINNGILAYQMNKGKKHREIVVHEKLAAIIEKYIKGDSIYLFPVIKKRVDNPWTKKEIVSSANSLINRYLKTVIGLAKIKKKISFHNSRHSFASIAYEAGIQSDTIKEALGHTNLSTTNAYLKSLSDKKINDEINKIYE